MNKKFLKVLFSMAFLLLLGKGLGFIRMAMIASIYGAGYVSDIYTFEDSLINEIYTIFATFLACTFIPKYLSLDKCKKNKLFSLLLNWGTIIMLALACFALIFTEPLLKIFVPGFFDIYDKANIIFVTRVNLIMLVLTFIVNYLMLVLQAHEIFVYLSLESVILNIIVIIYLTLLSDYGIIGLLLCRGVAYVVLSFLVVHRLWRLKKIKYVFSINPFDSNVLEMIKLSLPMLFITVLWQVNYMIDKSMASRLPSGSIACLNYANIISMIIYSVLGYVISTYAYPIISKVQDDNEQVKTQFKYYFCILIKLVLPIALLTMFYAAYISDLFYGRGNMTKENINIISLVLAIYIPGSVAYCIKNYYSKLFYIKKNTMIVFYLEIFGCFINIILNLILISIWGVYGLAFATSSSYILTVILQIKYANRKDYTSLRYEDLKNSIISVPVIVLISIISNQFMYNYLSSNIIRFIFVSLLYIGCCLMFCLNDIKKITIKKSYRSPSHN